MRIAVFLPNWIGDVVMATPAIAALRERYPDARMIGLLKPYVAGVLEGTKWFDAFVPFNAKGPWHHGTLAVATQLRMEKIDLAVLFTNTFRSALAACLGKCGRRVGYLRYGRGALLTDGFEPTREANGRLKPSPVLDAYNRLVEAVGAVPTRRMHLGVTENDEAAVDRVWCRHGYEGTREVICLNPGAAFGSSKYWPATAFAQLAQRLTDQRGSGVLVLCGPNERDLAHEIVHLTKRPLVRSLAEFPLSLGLSKACVRRADLLITTDSGPRHFAAAFGRPVVTLFGPTHIEWTETYHPLALHVQKQVDCGPCQKRICPLDHKCMTLITPDEIFAAAEQLLDPGPRPKVVRHAG